jgi:hypothetical protein
VIARIILLVAACLLLAGSPPAELPASADEIVQLDIDVAVMPAIMAAPAVAQRITYAPLAAAGSPGRLHASSIFRPPQVA